MPLRRRRPGTALLLTLLAVLVLDCVILGTLHLAILEDRLARNAGAALRLRLAAEGAARMAAAHWSEAAESLEPGGEPLLLLSGTAPDGDLHDVSLIRVNGGVFLLEATARQPAPGFGRRHASLLLKAPALPPSVRAVVAALATPGPVRIGAGASIGALVVPGCEETGTTALLVAGFDDVEPWPHAGVEGEIALLEPVTDVTAHHERMAGALQDPPHPSATVVSGDLLLEHDAAGVLVVGGDLVIAAGVRFTGFILVGGVLTVEEGAVLDGAAHAAGGAEIGGTLRLDVCAANDALADVGSRRPRVLSARAWIPAF